MKESILKLVDKIIRLIAIIAVYDLLATFVDKL